MAMTTEVFVDVDFDSAHWLPHVPKGHKCHGVHGHTYRLQLRIEGPVGDDGFVVDYQVVRDAWHKLEKQLDHKLLNDVDGLSNPTCENIGAWVLERMPMVTSVRIRETQTAGCVVRR
jgi:6-pyruvoyltetrahydropterin/6-carboxytetrahydropterin synthase